MPNIGPTELIIVAVIALLVLGPKRLPEAGRGLGRGLREFKSAITASADTTTASTSDAPSSTLTSTTENA